MPKTIAACLKAIEEALPDALARASNLQEEFSLIKKSYFRVVLRAHPDKGGDPAAFRRVQAAFEVVRDLYDSGRVGSFVNSLNDSTASSFGESESRFAGQPVPSWDYYCAAAEQPVPTYRVERARSNRSSCCQTGNAKSCLDASIAQGEVRIGSLDSEAGTYGRWIHLRCWRVPSKVWLGLPDPATCKDAARFEAALVAMSAVIICGVGELPAAERRAVAHLCMNKDNWAKLTKRTDPKMVAALLASGGASNSVSRSPSGGGQMVSAPTSAASSSSSSALATRGAAPRERFIVPVPGRDGVKGGSLSGKTFCLTGIFPELGGGTGLALGKERAQVRSPPYPSAPLSRPTRSAPLHLVPLCLAWPWLSHRWPYSADDGRELRWPCHDVPLGRD